ncbi:bifunctional 4-hydroxy-2-oxoglutarate aldolase/2-dehydro-3-deoxy-phosphogluconate aldolase [Candidatus Poribacteria bacterium]|nr:bifunctional 4-hydroxy-2-oxoglutarate aldolase/2-dehydro-3-deoxy-phosphogluconate aldolase [Candidatus Poribacteria bacterium]
MLKQEQMERIEDCGVVAIIRANSSEELIDVAAAIKEGGVDIIEVTMTTPDALRVISEVSKKYGDAVLIGVGSVLDAETARAAILAGAEFVVSPVVKQDVIELSRRYSKVVMPGAFTPTEILTAWEMGADYVKVFPSSLGGASYIKAVKAPLPQIPLVPTGGVEVDNAGEFIKAGSAALGVGSALVSSKIVAARKFDVLTETAQKLVQEVRKARQEMK